MSFDARKSKSISFRKINPHLFGLATTVRESDQVAALDQDSRAEKGSTQRVPDCAPRFRVAIIALRSRPLDGDNHVAGCKGLRDIIAEWIGIDDGDVRVTWDYGQVRSDSNKTLVVVEMI